MATFHILGVPVTIGFDNDLVEKKARYDELYEETLGADDGEPVQDWDEYNRKDQERVDLWYELRKEGVDFGVEEEEEEEEKYNPISMRNPLTLLLRAFVHFLITIACIIGIFYPFYVTGRIQQWIAALTVQDHHQGDMSKQGYMALATSDAIAVGIPPNLFVRQIDKESGFNPMATSPAGAEGIAQLMPDTASTEGVDPWNPTDSLNAAARIMAGYTHQYGGDYAKALAAYNGGPGVVESAVSRCGEATWINCLPGETQNYVRAILG